MNYLIAAVLIFSTPLSACAIKPDREYIRLPQQMGLVYKPIEVKTPDGYKIETWYFPAQEMPKDDAGSDLPLAYKMRDGKKRPTIIICNADSGNMSYFQLVLAMHYAAAGYNVATFDWRGFGASSEFQMDPDYFCYTEMLTDYDAVIAKVAQQPETDATSIYLFGWSTGGYLSMIAAHKNQSVRGCILRGVPTSFEAAIPIIKSEKGKKDENLLIPEDFPLDCMPLALAPNFRKDIMLVVGSEDTRTPVRMSQEIIGSLPDGIVKRLWIAKGAKHGGKEAPEFMYLNDFIRNSLQFLHDSRNQIKQ